MRKRRRGISTSAAVRAAAFDAAELSHSLAKWPTCLLVRVWTFLPLSSLATLALVNRYWNGATIEMLKILPQLAIPFKRLTPGTLVFLVGLVQNMNSLVKLSIAGELWEEKHTGIFGLILLKNPHLQEMEFTGPVLHSMLKEIAKYCPNLERLWKTDLCTANDQSASVANVPMDGYLLASLLGGCPKLRQLRIGAVRMSPSTCLPTLPPTGVLSHDAIEVLHIENIQWSHLPIPASRFTKCAFTKLRDLCVSEHQQTIDEGRFLPFSDILNIIDNSPELTLLEISAQFTFTLSDCERIVQCAPKLKSFRLRPYMSSFAHQMEARLSNAAVQRLLKGLQLQTLSMESIGWEEHWTNYADLEEPFLLLQHPYPSLSTFTSNIWRFEMLRSCVIFGEVTNDFVHALLSQCKHVSRLELYFLRSCPDVNDDLFSVVSQDAPHTALRSLHLHVWKQQVQIPLTYKCLLNIQKRFPNLEKLAVLGLPDTESVVCSAIAKNANKISHLVLGPVLGTTSELLQLLGVCRDLANLDLCWDGGSLPSSDEEFDAALGTNTLWSIIQQINPNLTVRDMGTGHFYPL